MADSVEKVAEKVEEVKLDEDAAKEAKRREVEKKVKEAMQLREIQAQAKANEESLNPADYGSHPGIACDGCNTQPILGYRWKCMNCKNHDLCDACYEQWKTGVLPHLNRRNNVSLVAAHHSFKTCAQKGSFNAMKGSTTAPKKSGKKVKPNDPCTCGSGKKYKKCCGALPSN
eukprot:m.19933 g.19933  ORF g.19933 m.19933 type:complete len:172 (+) comp6718_c0_seq1:122-637(+)